MTTREQYIALMTILRKEIRRFTRIWMQTLLPPVITTTLYFVIFGNLIGARIGEMGGYRYIEFVVPGLIMMSVITSSYGNVVSSFFGAKFGHHVEELLVSPTPNYIILWGFVLGGMARGLCVGAMIVVPCSLISCKNSHIERRISISTPAVGSSRISKRGSCTSARAIIKRRFMPPDNDKAR